MNLFRAIVLSALFNPRRCLVSVGAIALFVTVVAFHMGSYEAQSAYWDKFLPLAQLGLAVSLAYLALPYFRHTRMVVERALEIIGKTSDERDDFRRRLDRRSNGEAGDFRQLTTVVRIFELHESRSGKIHATMECYREARHDHCIVRDKAKTRFLTTYYVSADLVVVVLGVVFGLTVHLLALLSAIWSLHPSPTLATPAAQMAIGSALVVWTCGIPAYFGLRGNQLTSVLEDLMGAAAAQRQLLDNRESNNVESTIKAVAPPRTRPNETDTAKIFQVIAARLGAGEVYEQVLGDLLRTYQRED